MNRKSILLSLLALLLISSFFACKKEKTPAPIEQPTITIHEVGLDNSKKVYAGQDLHLDIEIKAPAKIASIKIQITLKETNLGWDFVKTYTTGYAGLKNANFHEHIDVPADAKTGIDNSFDLLVIVTDELGNKTQAKAVFKILKDATLPSATGTSIKLTGNMLNVVTNVTAPNKIAKISVEAQSSTWTKMFDFTDSDMVGQTTYSFNKSMEVSSALAAHHHINIFITDQAGKSMTYSYHFDK